MARVQDIYDNAPCGYHSLDGNGYFIEINQTELSWLGYQRDEVIGKKRFSDVLALEYAAEFHDAYAATKLSGVIRDVEFEMRAKGWHSISSDIECDDIVRCHGKRDSKPVLSSLITTEKKVRKKRLFA